MAFEIDLSLVDAFIQHLSGWYKAVLLSSSNFNTEGLALKICSISKVSNNISVETLKAGFHFSSPCVGGGELCRRVGH